MLDSTEIAISILAPLTLGLVWLVRLEARSLSNARGVQRADEHIKEGVNVKLDIGVLKNDTAHIKEDIREIKDMLAAGWPHVSKSKPS